MSKKKPDIEGWLCAENTSSKGQTFIRLTSDLLNAQPFTALSYSAQILYIRMSAAAAGRIEFVYPFSFYKNRMAKETFVRAKKELIDNGFITERQMKNLRKPNIYRFSFDWKRQL